jgi:PAS domain S-box-containing protein
LLLIAFTTVFSALFFVMKRNGENRQIEISSTRFLANELTQLQGMLEEDILVKDWSGVAHRLYVFGTNPHIRLLLLLDDRNVVVASNQRKWNGEAMTGKIPDYENATAETCRKNMTGKLRLSGDERRITGYYPVMLGISIGELRPSRVGLLFISYDLSELKTSAHRENVNYTLSIWFAFSLMTLAVGFILRALVTKRLARISASASRIAAGDYTATAEVGGDDEIAQLADLFNKMADKILKDISERNRAEEALRESEERFRTIVDTASDGILIARMSTRKFVEANAAICEMLGYTRDELLRIGVEDIHPATDLPSVIAEFNRQSRGEKRISESLSVMRKDGSVFYADVSANPVELEGEQYQVGIFRDTTGRKLAENALRESEERYHELFENANDVIYTHDLAGNFTSINKAAEQVTGYTPDEALKINILSVLAPGSVDVARRMISRKVTGGGQTRYELEIVCKNGCRVPLEVSTRIIYRGGKPFGVQGIARDITERKRAEEEREQLHAQLQQAMKMEAVGRLAGGVAHDFNNLLTVINGYSELLLQRLGENSPMRKDVEVILQAGNQAGALTRQLLVFSRKQVLQPKVIDLNMVVSKTGKMLRRLIGENIEFRTILAEGLGRVKADEGQVEQILLNLAINAKDAMPGGGELTIETANVVLDEAFTKDHPSLIPGPHVLLSVGDTGSGIPDEVRRHIFEPFFTTKEQGKGTGLGLATVYGIVQQSQGHLDFHTEAGKGTTFRIYLPRVEEDREALPTVPVEAPPGSETVLVVEDETSVREIVNRVLSAKGYRVLTASDGSEGLRVSGEYNGPIDLLLTDMVMPGMGGRELATRLEAGRAGMKVLFISGYTEDAISHEGLLEAGDRKSVV